MPRHKKGLGNDKLPQKFLQSLESKFSVPEFCLFHDKDCLLKFDDFSRSK
jgi:hypothetical protein